LTGDEPPPQLSSDSQISNLKFTHPRFVRPTLTIDRIPFVPSVL